MADPTPQSHANHRRIHFIDHRVLPVVLLACLAHAGWSLRRPTPEAVVQALVAVALVLLWLRARMMALAVQDRVIRLEERLRMARLLPPDLLARAEELTTGQLVALRFAGDGELAGLVCQVLDEKLVDRDAIKRRIQAWRPDHQRV